MAIPRKKVVAADQSTSTHFKNETTKPAEGPAATALNHQEAEMLSEPTDDEGGSTHFQNDKPNTKESRKMNASKTSAKAKPVSTKAASRITAGEDEDDFEGEDDLDSVQGPDADADFPEGGEDSGVEAATDSDGCEVGQQDTQHMPNDEDPAAGYLTTGSDAEFEEEDEPEFEDNFGATPQSLLEVDEDWDEEPAGVTAEFGDEEESPEEEEEEEDDEDEEEVDAHVATADSMDLVDVDGTEDDGDDVQFATAGLRVHAMKGNRIVATLSKKSAVAAGYADEYLSDEFQDVVGVEMAKHGLRAGLKNMGFVMAKVNITANNVVNKRVETQTQKVTAAIRRNSAATQASLKQCLAIAAVGINRSYFKDTRNELRAALEDELAAAGVRGASKMVRRVFAKNGVDYAKAILTLANKLSEMPEVTRNAFASALDLTNDGETDVEDDDDLFGDDASPDFQAETTGGADDEFDEETEDEMDTPNTVQAALANPQHRVVKASKKVHSVSASAVLNGDVPFLFLGR